MSDDTRTPQQLIEAATRKRADAKHLREMSNYANGQDYYREIRRAQTLEHEANALEHRAREIWKAQS